MKIIYPLSEIPLSGGTTPSGPYKGAEDPPPGITSRLINDLTGAEGRDSIGFQDLSFLYHIPFKIILSTLRFFLFQRNHK